MVELVEHQCDGQQETEISTEAQMDSSQFEETGASEDFISDSIFIQLCAHNAR